MKGPIDMAEIRKATRAIERGYDRLVKEELRVAIADAKQHVKTQSTFNRRSRSSLKDATRGKVEVTALGHRAVVRWEKNHASFIENGTSGHWIYPKRARFLRFEVEGKIVYASKVWHPGFGPYRFASNAMKFAGAKLPARLRKGLNRIGK